MCEYISDLYARMDNQSMEMEQMDTCVKFVWEQWSAASSSSVNDQLNLI